MKKRSSRRIRRVLITGATGSGGSYLADHIVENHPQVEVHGLSRWHSASHGSRNLSAKVELHECDLMDFASTLAAVEKAKPDAVFHLAAHANVRVSFIEPSAVMANNIIGTTNLLEAIRISGLDPWIQLCSTSEIYGQVAKKDVPIKETCALRPVSPYAVSKTAQDLLGWSYFKSWGMKIIRTRMFTYFNPRRTDLFATSFARQVALIEAGYARELRHGNLESVRTFIDVRDAVRAYWEAILFCEPGEAYNIGGTTTMTVGQCLQRLKALTAVAIPTKLDPALVRPADVTLQIPCVDKFRRATGWKPQHDFDDSLKSLLKHWRREVSRRGAEA
ncbi:MAG: GDP-mannose 4,6-dehydratase [Elusimicrobia bacterium]|nr:GDP-mannose 4,6-dehydratase [Elusimicrobiota bacterium]